MSQVTCQALPIFSYQARTQEGELQVGTVEAGSKEAAIDTLQRHRLIVVAIESKEETPVFYRKLELFQHVSQKEVTIFSRQLATLFEAQVPLIESLNALANQTANPYFKGIIFEVASSIEGGMSFSKSLAKHPRIFSHFYQSMARSGELSGKLGEVVSYLADYLEREYQIISKMRTSLIYPAFVLSGLIVVAVLMLVIVVPQLTAVFKETEVELPWVTRLIIRASDFTLQFGILFLILSVVGFLAVWQYSRTEEGKRAIARATLKIPVLGRILSNIYISRFSENLGTLILGGIPIAQALRVTGDVMGSPIYQDVLREAEEAVRRGESISSVLKTEPALFPAIVSQMVATGEETGKLDVVLTHLAKFYQREVTYLVDNLLTLIEPILIVILGIGVGIMVAAILMPIYGMVQVF